MLPEVLVSPPWTQNPAPAGLQLEPPAPRLAVADELRATWLARFPAPKRPRSLDLDDEVLDRYLDAIERRQKPRDVEVSWLTDGGLSDLLGEVGTSLSLKVAEYALARLGDDAADPVSRAATAESRLRPVLEHVFTPGLAVEMAKRLLVEPLEVPSVEAMGEQPYAPSETEQWLRRYGDDVARVLIPKIESELEDERAAMQKTLSLLALSGVPVSDLADAAGLPCNEQPRWMQYEVMPEASAWVPRLIVQPRSTAVEALTRDLESPSLARNLARWRDAETPISYERRELRAFFSTWMEAHAALVETALADPSYIPLSDAPDPTEVLRVPSPPKARPRFWNLGALPRVQLRDGTALPDEAMDHLSTMLQHFVPRAPYRGLLETIEACDPASLDAFGAAILEGFAAAEMDPLDNWVVPAAIRIGGAETFAGVQRMLRAVAAGVRRTFDADDGWLVNAEAQRAKAWVWSYAKLDSTEGWLAVRALCEDEDAYAREDARRAVAELPEPPADTLEALPLSGWDPASSWANALLPVAEAWVDSVLDADRKGGARWTVAAFTAGVLEAPVVRARCADRTFAAYAGEEAQFRFRLDEAGPVDDSGGRVKLAKSMRIGLSRRR